MILIYGLSSAENGVTENSNSDFILQIPMDYLECRRFKNVAFLSDIFINGRFEDSNGRFGEVRLPYDRIEKAVIFDKKNLNQLLEEYSSHLAIRRTAGDATDFEPERTTYEFLKLCRARDLELVSLSKLYLQEYE